MASACYPLQHASKCLHQRINLHDGLAHPRSKKSWKGFDLFMEPLVEELQQLWRGVLTRDLYSSPPADFFPCAVIIWCIQIIWLWALCQGERHMVIMHVFAVTGIRCHTQYLARSVTLDTIISLPRTSRVLQNTEDMCSMQSMKTMMRQAHRR